MLTAAVETIRAALSGASLSLTPTVEKRFFFYRKRAVQTGAESLSETPLITVSAADFNVKRISRRSFSASPIISVGIRAICETEERAGLLCDLTEEVIEFLTDVETDPCIQQIETLLLCHPAELNVNKVWLGELRLRLGLKGDE